MTSVLTTANPDEIEDWLKANKIEYTGTCSVSFCRWSFNNERDLVFFKLKWGVNENT